MRDLLHGYWSGLRLSATLQADDARQLKVKQQQMRAKKNAEEAEIRALLEELQHQAGPRSVRARRHLLRRWTTWRPLLRRLAVSTTVCVW